MLLLPLENTGKFLIPIWVQVKPRISQKFGLNPRIYAQFGLAGHNGFDLAVPVGTPVYAPCDASMIIQDEGKGGYGLHARLRSAEKKMEIILGHLSWHNPMAGPNVKMGDLIGYSGNTGFSTGPHLHVGPRKLLPGKEGDEWNWSVENYNNGFKGYLDMMKFFVAFKGTLEKSTILL